MSFFKEFIDYVRVDSDVVKIRRDMCESCPFLTKSYRCVKCGCFMKLKTTLGPAKCPIGKW